MNRPPSPPTPLPPAGEGSEWLPELMVTVAIAAIVLAVGIPGFQALLRENRLAAQTNAFLTALARSEAIKRGRRVTLCKSADGATCATSGGYHQQCGAGAGGRGCVLTVSQENPTVGPETACAG